MAGIDWLQEAELTADDGAAGDLFGCSVSISGDYAIVGSQGNRGKGRTSGSAYIFRHDGAGWFQQQKLTTSTQDTSSLLCATVDGGFGCSVSISGDYAIVGAEKDKGKGRTSGSAYIFRADGTGWVMQQKLTASTQDTSDLSLCSSVDGLFGCSVSISGDYAIVGAEKDECKGRKSGSAYIFRRDSASWVLQQKLTASDGTSKDCFGNSVSISGDFAIIGASGSAYIFKRDGAGWFQQQKLTAFEPDAIGLSCTVADVGFGCSVSISGDYAIVGAEKDKGKGQMSGSAYIFSRDGIGWVLQQKLTAPGPDTSDLYTDCRARKRFGYSVSISGNYAIVGARNDSGKGRTSGSAYIFNRDGSNWVLQQTLTTSGDTAKDRFGNSVSISGNKTIVGADGDDSDIGASGSAYIFGAAGDSELVVLTPNGGESLVAGSTYDITWDADGLVENVFLEYSDDNGANWTAVDTVANTGSYSWLVPNVNSSECLVSISDADYPATGDVSDDVFRIYVCTLAYDLNHDCFVDFFDFALLASEWLQCGDPCDPDCQ